jgi:integrase
MKGIKKQPDGSWRVYGMVRGVPFYKRFTRAYTLGDVKAWRDAKMTELRTGVKVIEDDGGGFSTDAKEYKKLVSGMISIGDRERHIDEWAAIFGSQRRDTITPFQIRRALEAKRKAGKAASTVNHFRTALLHFFTTMNGRSGANPVKDVPPYPEHSDEVIRAHDYGTIYRLLALMPPSKTRTRLRLIAWTGWPHAQVMKLKADDIDFAAARVRVSRRRKGKGVAGRWLPIVLPQTKTALEAFVRDDCFGDFSQPSMRKSLLLAAEKYRARYGRTVTITPYHLRHSFGTLLALYIEDERALQELLLCSLKQVRRYTAAATDPRVRSALEAVAKPVATGAAFGKLRAAVAGKNGKNFRDTGGNAGIRRTS